MEYSIHELSVLAGVSARTLRYYDQIGLLKPLYMADNGYRYYGEEEIRLLQQILFYRERGLDLKKIKRLVYQEDFDPLHALYDHLCELEKQRERVDALIRTVKQTILSMKGEYEMSDREKFEAFKEEKIRENEKKYGKEMREKYGDDEVTAANQKLLDMSREEWTRAEELEKEILEKLKQAVLRGEDPAGECGKEIYGLHRKWLSMTWKQYSAEAHKGVANMYTADERFTAYYDREAPGCAEFLKQAVCSWAGR